MKLAYNTNLYSEKGLEIAIEDISKAGYEGLEINPKHIFGAELDLNQIKESLVQHNLEISCIMGGWLDNKRILAQTKKVCEIAKKLNVKIIGTLPSRRGKINWPEFVKLLKIQFEMVAGHGLTLVIHHHGGCIVENPEEIQKVLNEIPSLGLLFDTAHWYPYGDIVDGIRQFKNKIKYVHLKDINPGWGFERMVKELSNPPSNIDAVNGYFQSFTDLGKGIIDFKKALKEFQKFYNGWFTVEIENKRFPTRLEHAKYNINYLKNL